MSNLRAATLVLLSATAGCLHPRAIVQPDSILCWTTRSFGTQPRLVVDLRLKSGNENRVPSSQDNAAVDAVGGKVLYSFHVAVLRAVVDTGSLRALVGARNGIADVAYPVADTGNHDVRVDVFYKPEMTPADDSTLTALGGRGFLRRPRGRVVSASLADSLVPVVARLPDVAFVRAQSMVCIETEFSKPTRR